MIKTYCDICGKELSEDCHDMVNLDFNSFGVSGFVLEFDKYKPRNPEVNLCVGCAESVVLQIEDLRQIKRQELIESIINPPKHTTFSERQKGGKT